MAEERKRLTVPDLKDMSGRDGLPQLAVQLMQ